MTSIKTLTALCLILNLFACAHIGETTKSSPTLGNLLGITELPDWYVRSRYTYPDSKWIDNDFGLRMHYRDAGEGPVILLLHGEASSLHIWEYWVDTLSQDYRVIALDLPGSGLTGATHCLTENMDTCAENISEDYIKHSLTYFIEDLKLSRFTLVGHSLGGYFAALYAKEHPEKVENLVLMSPVAHQQDVPKPLAQLLQPGIDLVAEYVQPATLHTSIAHLRYSDAKNLTEANVKRYIHLGQTEGAFRTNVRLLKMVKGLMEQGTLEDFSEISTNTLIIWGSRDKWVSVDHAERWQESIASSQLVKYPFSGNLIMEEEPELPLADITAFVAGDPLPSIDGGGSEGSFTIQDALNKLDQESLFGPKTEPDSAD